MLQCWINVEERHANFMEFLVGRTCGYLLVSPTSTRIEMAEQRLMIDLSNEWMQEIFKI
jgi:hypothetical protein